MGRVSRRGGRVFRKIVEARTHRSLGFAFLIPSLGFSGGRWFGRGSAPGAGLEFAADHVEVVREDAVTGVALIAGETHVAATVQPVVFETIDVALHGAVLVPERDKVFLFSCAVSVAFFLPRLGITTIGT